MAFSAVKKEKGAFFPMKEETKRIILFGTGTNGRIAFLQYGSDNIAYYCSNNANRWGEFFCGKQVISFDRLKEIFRDYRIIVTVQTYLNLSSISEQLKLAGIPFEEFRPDDFLELIVTTIQRSRSSIETSRALYQLLKLEQSGFHMDEYLMKHGGEELSWSEDQSVADFLFSTGGKTFESYSMVKRHAKKCREICKRIEALYFQYVIQPDCIEGDFE